MIPLNRMLVQLGLQYNKDFIKKLEEKTSTILGITIITIAVIVIAILLYKPHKDDAYIDESSYPVQAAEWIKENLNLSEITLYNEL